MVHVLLLAFDQQHLVLIAALQRMTMRLSNSRPSMPKSV